MKAIQFLKSLKKRAEKSVTREENEAMLLYRILSRMFFSLFTGRIREGGKREDEAFEKRNEI